MYGIFTYIWLIFMVNVGKYTANIPYMDPMANVKHFHFLGGFKYLRCFFLNHLLHTVPIAIKGFNPFL